MTFWPVAASKRLLTALWLGHWCLLVALTHAPIRISERAVRHGEDKLVHVLLYFALTLLGGWRIERQQTRAQASRLLVWALIYLLFAAADEWTQRFVGRTPSFADWLADATGIALATCFLLARWKRTEKSRA